MVDIEQAQIPDGTYRQIKKLHEALIAKANLLIQVEARLSEKISDFEVQKRQFDERRIEAGQSRTEARLSTLIRHDKGEVATVREDAIPTANPQIELDNRGEIDFVEVADLEEVTDFEAVNEILAAENLESTREKGEREVHREIHKEIPAEIPSELGLESHQKLASESQSRIASEAPEFSYVEGSNVEESSAQEQLASLRLQNSAKLLREKSEFLSAVFVELDQMVRDLDRQQKLLEQIQIGNADQSATEFQEVSDKVKKRFHRISRQIHTV